MSDPFQAPVPAVAPASSLRRTRGDRVLLASVLVSQLAIMIALALLFFQHSRRQHEPLGTPPNPNATPPNRGTLVLSSDPLPATPTPQIAAVPATALSVPAGGDALHMPDELARMQADLDRQMLGLLGGAPSLPPFPGHDDALDAHIDRMMQHAFASFRALEDSMHFDEGWAALGRSPTLDMHDAGKDYVVVCSLPGLDETEVQVTLEGRLLTILGQSSSATARRHFNTVQFERRVFLPGPVGDGSDAGASLTNGVLRIVVPKADQMPQVAKLTRLL